MTEIKKRPFVGVGVAVVREGKVLLGKRKGAHGEGEWAFPGGHLEFGESVEACAARELKEEAGMKALSVEMGPWTSDLMGPEKHYITIFTFIPEFEGEPRLLEPDKCEGWEWFSWDQLPAPLFSSIRSLMAKEGVNIIEKYLIHSQIR